MSAFTDTIVEQIIANVEPAAKQAGLASFDIAKAGVKGFLEHAIPDVEGWVSAFLAKTLPEDQFKQLLEDLSINALENGLKIAGLAEVEIDKTRNTILKIAGGLVSDTLSKMAAI